MTYAWNFTTDHETQSPDWFVEPCHWLCFYCPLPDCLPDAPRSNPRCLRYRLIWPSEASQQHGTEMAAIPLPEQLRPGLVKPCASCRYCDYRDMCAEDVRAGGYAMCEQTAAVMVSGVLVRL